MGFQTDKLSATDYVELPSLTTAEIDAAILAAELPAGSLVYNSDTSTAQAYNGTEVTPIVFSPGLQSVITVTDTDINNAFVTPITLVPAQGAGKIIVLLGGNSILTYGSAPFDFSGTAWKVVTEGDTVNQGDVGFASLGGFTQDFVSVGALAAYNGIQLPPSAMTNKALQLGAFIGPSTGGTGCTVKITTYYSVIEL